MSFLTPLYVMGALAIAGPILFHLIRRQPKGDLRFSSLMFLSPSPPRLSRRSRLDQWFLLALRALALGLLALAFGRPFLRSAEDTPQPLPGRRICFLLDSSASMSRDDLVSQLRTTTKRLLEQVEEGDELFLFLFDQQLSCIYEPPRGTPIQKQQESINLGLRYYAPTSFKTDLSRALVGVCEHIRQLTSGSRNEGAAPLSNQVFVITDLQEGAATDELQTYPWPGDVFVEIIPLQVRKPSNAWLTILGRNQESHQAADTIPVRITNSRDSQKADFQIFLASGDGIEIENTLQSIHVPPGTSRTTVVPNQPNAVGFLQVVLEGDDHPFDNRRFVQTVPPRERTLLFIGPSVEDPRQSLDYFLRKASLDSPWQRVSVVVSSPDTIPPELSPDTIPLIVIAGALGSERMPSVKGYLDAGGRILCVAPSMAQAMEPFAETIRALSDDSKFALKPGTVADYAMLGKVDFSHPLFEPFVDPQFNDFTKIRFWSRRELLLGDTNNWRELAWFDDRQPALVEHRQGQGLLWVLAAGWQPEESQFALSSKFVPILSAMFDPRLGAGTTRTIYDVGEFIDVTPEAEITMTGFLRETTILKPMSDRFLLSRPALFDVKDVGDRRVLAANIPVDESRTAPMTTDMLEQFGVRLGLAPKISEQRVAQRQMKNVELERQQSIWKWLIAVALGVLGVETMLGWRFARKP